MNRITEEMLISDIMDIDPNITEVFLKNGLNCTGCPGAASESLREAAKGHNVDLKKLTTALNRYLESGQ